MTIRAMNWAWGIELPPAMKLVLLKLADRANDDGECWPGMQSVAQACGVCERTMMRHIDAMVDSGLIERVKRKDDSGRQMSNLYRLNIDHQPGDKLSPGDDEPGDKSNTNRVTSVSPVIKEETTVLNHSTHAPECARDPEPIAQEPVTFTGVKWIVDDTVFDGWIIAYQNGRTHQDTEDWIEAELAKAALWVIANPRKRKKQWLRFLTGWLTRASQATPYRGKQTARPYH